MHKAVIDALIEVFPVHLLTIFQNRRFWITVAVGTIIANRPPGGRRQSRASGPHRTQCAEGFESSGFLEVMGATIRMGTTGNNLRDLRILLHRSC
jgi:hypothetical protein